MPRVAADMYLPNRRAKRFTPPKYLSPVAPRQARCDERRAEFSHRKAGAALARTKALEKQVHEMHQRVDLLEQRVAGLVRCSEKT